MECITNKGFVDIRSVFKCVVKQIQKQELVYFYHYYQLNYFALALTW